ncbi:PREDICTED: basic leucine zipper 8-like [Camelina sativa]|uniref:Basic leucine zipper 8-like n=1 Tax=Camelina sativa TaxID=90675 RepID=A0ABM0Z8H4_CAMSA|nr:PREDICTED: basic leucine zipper 8-like [Camelina sativa]
MAGFVYNLPSANPSPQSFFKTFGDRVPLVNLPATSEDSNRSAEDDERKRRRKVSNRESARRSRMRKRRHMDELWSMLVQLINENKCLVDELSRAKEGYDKVIEENMKLREENSKSRKMIGEIRLNRFLNVDGDKIWTV